MEAGQTQWKSLDTPGTNLPFKGAQSQFVHIEKFSLNSNSSLVIPVNLLHP